MTKGDEDRARWEGVIETIQAEHKRRIARLESAILALLLAVAGIGVQALGLIP